MKRLHAKARDERGASLIETALMSFVLLLLFAGAVDVGRMYYSYVVITNAAREGARMAARLPCYTDRSDLKARIVAATQRETAGLPSKPSGAVTITINPDPVATGCAAAGSPIKVTVSYQYSNWFASVIGSAGFTMSNSASMVAFGNDQL